MSPYRRAALLLIRLVAFGLMLFSILQMGAYFFLVRTGKTPDDSLVMISLKTLPLLIGFGLLIKSSSIAKRVTEDFE
ncbi:MAG: hypothetical protein H0X66_09055 [Verrucomicrobia bacterium]|nr:hypothetical protein [Verrucomicrobiota bacterium]